MSKSVLITGAANGIGLASAKVFASAGYQLVLTDIDCDKLASLVKEIEAPAIAVEADVRDRTSLENAFTQAIDAFGLVDVVHANANAGVSMQRRNKNLW